MYKAIIFDVDGTIIDTEEAILKSLQKVLENEGRYYPLAELRFCLGIPGKETLKRLEVENDEEVLSKWSQTVLEFSDEVKVFKGIRELLQTLSDSTYKLGIVTSKTGKEVQDEFDPFGLSGYFECIISASDTQKHKPHPEPLLACLNNLGVKPDEAVYIGDSIYDLQCAHTAGVQFALAHWGSKTTKGFETADYILETPESFYELVK